MSSSSLLRFGVAARSLAIIGSLIALAGSVSFAALQSPAASLTNNTIQSASADLRIGTSATSFATSRSGFDFTDLVPGGNAQPAAGHAIWLKNYGTATLGVRVSIGSVPINPAVIDLSQVFVVITRQDTGATQVLSLQSLIDAHPDGLALTDNLGAGQVAEYKLQAKMTEAAFTGSAATVSDIDLVFNAQANTGN